MSDFKAKVHQIQCQLRLCPRPAGGGRVKNGRERGEGEEWGMGQSGEMEMEERERDGKVEGGEG